jgi:hypothetical protein
MKRAQNHYHRTERSLSFIYNFFAKHISLRNSLLLQSPGNAPQSAKNNCECGDSIAKIKHAPPPARPKKLIFLCHRVACGVQLI